MAGIVDYASLKTEINNFLHRSDMGTEADTLIQLAESDFNRGMRFRQMLTTVNPSTSSNTIPLPVDFLELRNLELQGDPIITLKFVTTEQKDLYDGGNSAGMPRMYSIIGTNIHLRPMPDVVYTANLQYYQKLPTLVGGANTTNWLLTAHPDLYLWAALAKSSLYIGQDPRLPEVMTAYQATLADAVRADAESLYSGDTIAMQPDVTAW